MIYYLTGQSESHIRQVLTGIYEATLGTELPRDEAGEKQIPQNDGRVQFHHPFSEWVVTPGVQNANDALGGWLSEPVLKPGYHCALGIHETKSNPDGVMSEGNIAILRGAGIEVFREDEIAPEQLALLPKFLR